MDVLIGHVVVPSGLRLRSRLACGVTLVLLIEVLGQGHSLWPKLPPWYVCLLVVSPPSPVLLSLLGSGLATCNCNMQGCEDGTVAVLDKRALSFPLSTQVRKVGHALPEHLRCHFFDATR